MSKTGKRNKKRVRARRRSRPLWKNPVRITLDRDSTYCIFSDKMSGYLQADDTFSSKNTALKWAGSDLLYTINTIFHYHADKAIRVVKVVK